LRNLVQSENIIWRDHILVRMSQRNISISDVMNCVKTGEIIEEYPNDYPYPSVLILGRTCKDVILHLVCAEGQGKAWMITVYEPDTIEWFEDFKKRRK
jgi:hypothetical protein